MLINLLRTFIIIVILILIGYLNSKSRIKNKLK